MRPFHVAGITGQATVQRHARSPQQLTLHVRQTTCPTNFGKHVEHIREDVWRGPVVACELVAPPLVVKYGLPALRIDFLRRLQHSASHGSDVM